jgi:phosphoribosylaminoimidazole-succinocarboxamide synthase
MAAIMESASFQASNTRTLGYVPTLAEVTPIGLSDIDTSKCPGFIEKYVGKVRDTYKFDKCMVLVTTDRQSAFDRSLTEVPCKGQVLNLTSLWWFKNTQDFVPNHVIANPHPNVTIGRKCDVFQIEFVMRGYITGSTSTSLWTNYNKGA